MANSHPGPARNVDEVIEALDEIVSWARTRQSPLGYFAALYVEVTRTVARGTETGFFDDDHRMQDLVTVFANRYLAALGAHRHGARPTGCWGVAFDAADDSTLIVLQHLLLGINAHINLDLGVAAAEVSPGDAITGLRADFDRINQILAMMTSEAQHALAQISPWLGVLDVVGGRTDDEVVRFSIEVARHEAWRFAVELARTPAAEQAGPIAARDRFVAQLGRRVRRPGLVTPALWLIRLRESKDVRRNLDVLASISGPDLATVEAHVREDGTPS